MTSLGILQTIMVRRLGDPGLDATQCEMLGGIEARILRDPQLHADAAARARIKRRIQTMPAFDPQHVQGLLRRVTISKSDGSVRETWSPTNADYAASCYHYLGILHPMLKDLSDPGTHGSIPLRGTSTAIRQLIATISQHPQPFVIQTDIKNWFPTVPIKSALEMLPPLTARATLQSHLRYRQAAGGGTPLQGLPQGHPMSPATAALVLDKTLGDTRSRFAMVAAIIAYVDDVVIVARNERTADAAMAHMEAALEQHDVHLNQKKTRKNQPRRGDPMDYLGYRIDWPGNGHRPRIRPSAKAYRRLAERLAVLCDPKEAAEAIRGWLNGYRLTNDPEAQRELDELIRAQGHLNLVAPNTNHAP
jgi:hypothetical protein